MSKRDQLMRVQEEPDGDWFLVLSPRKKDWHAIKPAGEISIKELIRFLEVEAEGDNYHDQVGAAKTLAKLITEHAGEKAAHAVLLDIAEVYGGVHRL